MQRKACGLQALQSSKLTDFSAVQAVQYKHKLEGLAMAREL